MVPEAREARGSVPERLGRRPAADTWGVIMRFVRSLAALGLAGALAAPAYAVWGVDDQVPSASLLVPFFEVGIDVAHNPHDTLPIVYNRGGGGSALLHYEVRTVDGARAFWGHETVAPFASWSGSLRDLIAAASPGARAMLVDGDFYRGFMTIDLVDFETDASPFDSAVFPFRDDNDLLGYIYYLRLAEGSANGLAMVPLEATTEVAPPRLRGFYTSSDNREPIDVEARTCAAFLVSGGTFSGCDTLSDKDVAIRSRVFQSPAVGGRTRLVIFAWDTSRPTAGGPSAICAQAGTNCPTSYSFTRFSGDGNPAETGTVQLPHVVTVLEPSGAQTSGEFAVFGVRDPGDSLQVFAFTFNSAQPAGNPNINWDAIFVASVQP